VENAVETTTGSECRTVFALQRGQRTTYCNSPACVRALLQNGWKLSDPGQLSLLVRALSTDPSPAPHHFSEHGA
jgi:hypothetical protein